MGHSIIVRNPSEKEHVRSYISCVNVYYDATIVVSFDTLFLTCDFNKIMDFIKNSLKTHANARIPKRPTNGILADSLTLTACDVL